MVKIHTAMKLQIECFSIHKNYINYQPTKLTNKKKTLLLSSNYKNHKLLAASKFDNFIWQTKGHKIGITHLNNNTERLVVLLGTYLRLIGILYVLSPVHTKHDNDKDNYNDNYICVHTSERYRLFILSARASACFKFSSTL